MDYSAEQQQQYQQQQYQAEQPQSEQQSYDPSQYQAYYASYNTTQQQQYQYYPSHDYATNTASSTSYHTNSASIHPAGVPLRPDPTYYQSTLSHFPANFDAVRTIIHPPLGQSAHRGGGRKGGRLFRGGGRGHGRGCGLGGGRHGPPHGGVPNSAPSASVPGQAPLTGQAQAQVPAAPVWPPPRMAWCELCRVDCNTPEILEQHKNGKRHKKNLQTHSELQNLNKVITGQQNVQMPNSEVQTEVIQPEKVEGSGEKQKTQESLPFQASTDNDRNETELQKNTVDKPEVNTIDSEEEPQRKARDQFVARGRGFKRKMRGGRGGKYLRTCEGSRRPIDPPKPKEVIPFICELCNVKCESQVVFNSHLAGKKHLANVKRFHGHRALYGEAGLQALYPSSNLNAPSSSVTPQVPQGVNDPHVLLAQLLTYVLAQAQAPGLLAAQVQGLAAAVAQVPGSGQETQHQYNSQSQGPHAISETENKNIKQEAAGQSESITSKSEVPATASIDTKVGNVSSNSEEKDASLHLDAPVIAASEKPDDNVEQDLSATMPDKPTPVLKSEANVLVHAVQPAPGKDLVDAELENEKKNPESEPEEDPEEDSELEHEECPQPQSAGY